MKEKNKYYIEWNAAMEKKKIDANKLSKHLQIPLRSIYNYLSGDVEPSATNYIKINNYLNK